MRHCPSHEWDRYVDELDRAAAEKAEFWKQNKAEILAIAAALINSPFCPTKEAPECLREVLAVESLVDLAGDVVAEVVARGSLE